jgi:predicted Zn-dependent protease
LSDACLNRLLPDRPFARRLARAAAAALALASGGALAAAYVPQGDSVVLERLPVRPDDPALAEVRKLRAALARDPGDPDTASELAKRYFELAAAEGDPRYIGYAVAALRPWQTDDAPPEVLYARGLLRQYRHDFDGALKDFALTLKAEPDHAGAHSWRAAILMVQADYPAAAAECASLASIASELRALGCSTYVEATTGKTLSAYQRLSDGLQRNPDIAPEFRLWILTRLAEMAWRLEDHAAAERLFKEGLALGIDDNFLLAAYADYLLEKGRPKEVVALLKKWERSDTLLLRLALAEKALGMREAAAHVQALGDRFAAAALRGERLHMGEEARYLLDLKGDARAALQVALENWKDQREPRDALVVLEAAAAARDPKAASPVLRWLESSGFESERMKRAAASLR